MYSNWLKSFHQNLFYPSINRAKKYLVNFTFQPSITVLKNLSTIQLPTQMKHNNAIDFFSSPNSKFIGFSDIRHPQQENPQSEFEPVDEQRKMCRKLSFTVSGTVEPIMPFGLDFFDDKLEECEEPQEYSQEKERMEMNENSLMMEGHFRSEYQLMKSPQILPKQAQFISTPHTMRIQFQDHRLQQKNIPEPVCKIQPQSNEVYTTPRRKSQIFSGRKSCDSTAQKSISRNNQKGLRRLSSLAYSIVSQSTTTTYKEVAEKLLNHLNFYSAQMDEEDGPDKSSMQNVKRRVYDSLNVLLALGVIKRVGSKIAKQKQRKPFTTDTSADLDRYNEMLVEYNQRVKALEMRRKTQKQLKEKLEIFRKTLQRNKKTKPISKGKLIRVPFLAFISAEQAQIEWVKKEAIVVEAGEKKKTGKRGQRSQPEKITEQQHQCIQVSFKECPQSYGDLDFFKLLQYQDTTLFVANSNAAQTTSPVNNNQLHELQYEMGYGKLKYEEMNLVDEVLGE